MAAEPASPPIPWNAIEAWATSAPVKPSGTDVAEKTAARTPPVPADPSAPAGDTTTAGTDAATTAARPGERKTTPQAWMDRYAQISAVMGSRLKATALNQYRQLFEIHYLMEQYDKALYHLTNMLKEPRKWPEEEAIGWLAGRLWETALLKGGNLNAETLKKFYDEWVVKERARLKLQASVLSSAALKIQEQHYEGHQAYFQTTQNIAELIRQKELEGESNPAALFEMSERFHRQHPDVPVVHLRFLYKLREWYPQFPAVRNGTVQQRISHALAGDRMRLYKEAAEEMELLLQKWPQAGYSTNGYGNYYAGRYWQYHGDALKATREKNALRDARDAWQKALAHALKVQQEFPQCPLNEADDGETSTIQSMIRQLNDEDRLGSRIGR